MISANQAFDSTNITITSLSYIDTLVAEASDKGLYFIKVDGINFNDDMSQDLIDNYGYTVIKQYFDMGLYPVYTISWNS